MNSPANCSQCGGALADEQASVCLACCYKPSDSHEDSAAKPKVLESREDSSVLEIFALLGTGALAAFSMLMLFRTGVTIVGSGSTGSQASLGVGSVAWNAMGCLFWGAVGIGCSYGFMNILNSILYPATHSARGRLRQLVELTRSVNTDGVSNQNFYTNAGDRELVNLYGRLTSSGNIERLPELIHEARRRVESTR